MADIITPVYGGRATITFNEGKHLYTVSVPEKGIKNLWQPSVTGIIRVLSKAEVLIPWAIGEVIGRAKRTFESAAGPFSKDLVFAILDSSKNAHNDRKKEAGDIGTYVHNYLEAELKFRAALGYPPNLPADMPAEYKEAVTNAISAGLRWFDTHKIQLVQAEAPRWSATYGYIGTGDLIAYVDDELCVVDYKTSKRLYPTVFLQTAAYQKAFQEEFPDMKITRRWGLHTAKDGKLSDDSRKNDTLEEDFAAFQALHTAWRWDRENQGEWSKPAPPIIGQLL